MRVQVSTAGALTRSMLDGRTVIEGTSFTIRGLMEALTAKYGPGLAEELLDQGNLKDGLCMLLNGRNIFSLPQRYETPLQDGDEVLIAIVIAGG
jgi:molybdopterin converting factor small subunit